ncbi:MAG: restriction endonuclease subunit S [Vulcanimicrobiota bacterium]
MEVETKAVRPRDEGADPTLPEGWVWTRLGEIAEVRGGKRLPKGHDYSQYPTIYPYIRVTDFYNMSINQNDLKYIDSKTQQLIKHYVISNNDVYISIAGSIGKVGLIPENLNGANLTENAAKITNFKSLNKKYLCFTLNSTLSKEQINKLTISTNQPKLALFRIEQIRFPLPPLSEQHRIVAKIEELFTKLDAGVEALKKVKTQVKRYRQAVLKYAFEGKLTGEWREAHKDELEPASVLLERIKEERKKNAKGKSREIPPIVTSRLPELPEGWVWINVGSISDIGTGVTPLRSKKEYYNNGNIPWITSSALNRLFVDETVEYVSELALKETKLKIFPKGSLLVALYGEGKTRGKVSELRIDATTNQACAAIIFDGLAKKCKDYIKYFFLKNYEDIRRLSSGGVQPNLNLSIINSTIFPLPSLLEQHQIVSEIERHFSIADEVEKIVDHSLKQADRLRQSILKRAFEGKLVPQDPNDEPAEKLLERIRHELESLERSTGTKRKKVK